MTKHLQAKYRDPRIQSYELAKLTPMDLHSDERWKTRDLPSIQLNGLWYPIMLYKVPLDWWNGAFTKWRPKTNRYIDPIVNEDNMIWAIKMGSNRYQCAVHLGYDKIDAIMFNNVNDCVKLAVWFRECDPLNNNNAPPYTGAYGYKDVI
jgi:hypothetical protein